MERHEFPEGEEPEILTGISGACDMGHHEQCPGIGERDGEPMFCVCECHKVKETE